ncbi:MAG: T9SS type A sorting domain-containing protein, partial [Bacteroidales bacterium]|nr:T9SS type A sorting domain-containing protein [Bacteroidales bacterium]
GNPASVSQIITVNDVTAPTITPQQSDIYVCYPDPVNIIQVQVTDNCDPNPTVVFTRSDDPTLGPNDPFPVGITTVTWTATDYCNNTSTHSFIVMRYPQLICGIQPPAVLPMCGTPNHTLTSTAVGADTYYWTVTSADNSWVITGGQNSPTITYDAGSTGVPAVFTLTVTNGNGLCVEVCDITITCIPPMYCTMTQGFYGNPGGMYCGYIGTQPLLQQLLTNGLIIGEQTTNNYLALVQADAGCVLSRLPSGGPASALNGAATCANPVGIALHPQSGKFHNVLLGQAITLGLNLELDADLATMVIHDNVIVTAEATSCDKYTSTTIPGTDMSFTIPWDVYSYFSSAPEVQDIYDLANQALGGNLASTPAPPSLGDIAEALAAINEAFDECRKLVDFNHDEGNSSMAGATGNPNINIYPNPSKGAFKVSIVVPEDGEGKVDLISTDGSLVEMLFESELKADVVYEFESVSRTTATGVYFLRFIYNDKAYYSKVVVIK